MNERATTVQFRIREADINNIAQVKQQKKEVQVVDPAIRPAITSCAKKFLIIKFVLDGTEQFATTLRSNL